VLVCTDLLGLTQGRVPRFVRKFGELGEGVRNAVTEYIEAVQDGTFPSESESFR